MQLGNLYTRADFRRFDSGDNPNDTNPPVLHGGDYAKVVTSGLYNIHCLSEWNFSVQVSGIDGRFQIGLIDTQFGGTHPSWFIIDPVAHTLSMYQDGGEGYTKNIQTGFDFSNFTLKVHYKDCYAVMIATDSAGIVATNRIRYNLTVHAGNSIGTFGMKYLGTSNAVLGTVSVSSALEKGMDFLFIGDNITLGKMDFPESYRFADRLKKKYQDDGLSKRIEVFAANGATLDDIITLDKSIVGVAPLNVVIYVGSNISPTDLANIGYTPTVGSWGNRYCKFIKTLQAAGIRVRIMSITPVSAAPFDFRPIQNYTTGYINDELRGMSASRIYTFDVFSYMMDSSNYGVVSNPSYLADFINPTLLGHQRIADLMYPNMLAAPELW